MLMGPAGFFEMPDGVIRAMRHVHMSPADAEFYGVKARRRHEAENRRRLRHRRWTRCLCRVDTSFKLEVHIDTDEGNACNLQPDTPCELIK